MPYTPPATRSPAETRSHSPRSNSFSTEQPQHQTSKKHGSKKDLPRSSPSQAYLSKHRRSPTLSEADIQVAPTSPPNVSRTANRQTNTRDYFASKPHYDGPPSPASERQFTFDDMLASASGSPPSSGDEETNGSRGRIGDVANLAELEAAIRNIEQNREGSPDYDQADRNKKAQEVSGLPPSRIKSPVVPHSEEDSEISDRPPLTQNARKVSHSRSSTDASAFLDFPRHKFESPDQSTSVSDMDEDEEDEEDWKLKPSLIRKKSGELVRPALRASSMRRRPSSMPGTPTYSKSVHFQENSLEHVRHFLQVDRPLAVSAGSSPVEAYDDEMEFPFGDSTKSLTPPFDWEIRVANFPQNQVDKLPSPVKVERIYLSADTRVLIGSVAVRNLAFHKLVVARFTLDYWRTTSEVVAEYNNDVRKKVANDGYDRFAFNIKLEDQANLENKTMLFCVRYNVNGREYWDNNGSLNYQVDFSKKYKPQNGNSIRNTTNLPRSKPTTDMSPRIRPRSMPSFDDFATANGAPYDFSSFPHPSSMIGESPIRFKNKPPSGSMIPDAPGKPKNSANQQAFGNRYDFGASLSAAISAATKEMGERQSPPDRILMDKTPMTQGEPLKSTNSGSPAKKATISSVLDKPSALTAEKPSLQSTSYHELLDKYCFFGSGKATASPPKTRSGFTQAEVPINETPNPPPPTPASAYSGASESAASSPSRASSPVEEWSSKLPSSRASRSASPAATAAFGSRTASSGAFGYPYHQRLHGAGFFETQTPTAIQG